MESTVEQLTKDGKVTKRIIKPGVGKKPSKKSHNCVHYEGYLAEKNTKFDSSRDRKAPFTFTLEEGKVIDAWELAIPTMQIGEIAEICCTYEYGYGEKGSPPIVPKKANLRFEVELLGSWESAAGAKAQLKAASEKKQEGNALYKEGQVELALFAYRKAREYIIDLWDCEPEELAEARLLVIAIQLNISMCYLKLRQWEFAIEVCKKVLDRDPFNTKACYRLGQAYLELESYDAALEFVQHGLKAAPEDPDLKAMAAKIKQSKKKAYESRKEMYGRMFA